MTRSPIFRVVLGASMLAVPFTGADAAAAVIPPWGLRRHYLPPEQRIHLW